MKDCLHRCPELDACINSSLWCDGINHCPSGYDESIRHCYEIFQLPALYLAFGFIGLVCLLCAVCIALFRSCKKRRRRQARLKNLPSDSSLFGDKEVICWHSDGSGRYLEVDRVTTVWSNCYFFISMEVIFLNKMSFPHLNYTAYCDFIYFNFFLNLLSYSTLEKLILKWSASGLTNI